MAMVGGVVSAGGVMEKESELLASLPSWLKLPAASEKELLATESEACVAPLVAGVRTAVYEVPEPEKLESEPLATEISASVKSEEASES